MTSELRGEHKGLIIVPGAGWSTSLALPGELFNSLT
jgi:hypothetical protein